MRIAKFLTNKANSLVSLATSTKRLSSLYDANFLRSQKGHTLNLANCHLFPPKLKEKNHISLNYSKKYGLKVNKKINEPLGIEAAILN